MTIQKLIYPLEEIGKEVSYFGFWFVLLLFEF